MTDDDLRAEFRASLRGLDDSIDRLVQVLHFIEMRARAPRSDAPLIQTPADDEPTTRFLE